MPVDEVSLREVAFVYRLADSDIFTYIAALGGEGKQPVPVISHLAEHGLVVALLVLVVIVPESLLHIAVLYFLLGREDGGVHLGEGVYRLQELSRSGVEHCFLEQDIVDLGLVSEC